MNKWIAIIILAAALLAGCGDDGTPSRATENTGPFKPQDFHFIDLEDDGRYYTCIYLEGNVGRGAGATMWCDNTGIG